MLLMSGNQSLYRTIGQLVVISAPMLTLEFDGHFGDTAGLPFVGSGLYRTRAIMPHFAPPRYHRREAPYCASLRWCHE